MTASPSRLDLLKRRCTLLGQFEQVSLDMQEASRTQESDDAVEQVLEVFATALDERQRIVEQINALDGEMVNALPPQSEREQREFGRYKILEQELVRRSMLSGTQCAKSVSRVNAELTSQLYEVKTTLRHIEAYFPQLLDSSPREMDVTK